MARRTSVLGAACAAYAATIVAAHLEAAELAPVVVTAKRFPEPLADAPIGTAVITAADIAASTATTIPELLAAQTGIITRDNTGSPDASIDLHGFGATGDQNTLVLVNGQRLSEHELVAASLSSIALAAIERIEIVRGGGAVLYGSGATGGTINIITRSIAPREREAMAGVSAGSYRTGEARGRLGIANDQVGLTVNARHLETDNYRRNNELKQDSVDGEVRVFGVARSAALKFGYDKQALRLPGARTQAELATDPRGASTPRDFGDRETYRASLSGETALGSATLAADAGYRNIHRTSSQKDYSGFGFPDNFVDTQVGVWSFTPRLRMPLGYGGIAHSLVAGIDYEDWDYESRRASGPDALASPNARILGTRRSSALYALQHSDLTSATRLTLGARAERVKTTTEDTVNPAAHARASTARTLHAWELALRHQLSAPLALYGRAGRSFRVATIDENYSQFGGPAFDSIVTPLEPQRSHDYELGTEYRVRGTRLRLAAYEHRLTNEIHFFAPTFSNINLPPTLRRGAELEGAIEATPALRLSGGIAVVEAKFREGVIGGVDVAGKRVPLVPRDSANAGLAWRFAPGARLHGTLRYVGRQRYDNDQANTFATMPSYTVTDFKLTYEIGRLYLGAGVNNLFDKQYYSYGIRNGAGTSFNAYPQRGRNYLATAEYRF